MDRTVEPNIAILWEPNEFDGLCDQVGIIVADAIRDAYWIGVDKGARFVIDLIEAARESEKQDTTP